MKPSLLVLAVLAISCSPIKMEKIHLESLEYIDLATFEANFNYPDTIDTISAQLHKALLAHNSLSHTATLDVNILFNEIESGSEGPYKYFKTAWTDQEQCLILAIVPAKFSYLLIVSDRGVLHDAMPFTHYLPGPLTCDFDRREIISFNSQGEIVLEETYGVALAHTDSCKKVENTDRYKINDRNYFEFIDRKTTTERRKKYE